MHRFIVGTIAVLLMLFAPGATLFAASGEAAIAKAGPYEGLFEGRVYGDRGSSAPITLDLTHRGSQVEGGVSLGEGLNVSGGFCGTVDLPAISQHVEGQTVRWNPNRLVVSPTFDVGNFDITVDFESNVSTDGEVITARAKIDLPWFCGRDPVLTSTLYRD